MLKELNDLSNKICDYYNSNSNGNEIPYEDMMKNDDYFRSLVMRLRRLANILARYK